MENGFDNPTLTGDVLNQQHRVNSGLNQAYAVSYDSMGYVSIRISIT